MRLASRDRVPRATLVTTGTGSGKTESFQAYVSTPEQAEARKVFMARD